MVFSLGHSLITSSLLPLMLTGLVSKMPELLHQHISYFMVGTLLVGPPKNRRQVARSSTETEYTAVASVVAETNWLFTLSRISIYLYHNLLVFSVIMLVPLNPVFHSRMKHVAIDFHFVRDQVEKQQIEVKNVHSGDQLADAFTKPLPKLCLRLH